MRLVMQTTVPMKFCLFVDGLDEYDGDHETIAEFFKSIAALPNVKVCISSRPYLVYEDTFKGSPSLRLQDLTFQDIELYTIEKLQKNSRFQKLAIEEPEQAPILIREIVMKANGVFLWVTLVVDSLLAGLRNRDDLSVLQQRLRALPADLEHLYEHMLKVRIESVYESQSSRIFQLVQAVDEPLTVLSLALALDEKLHKTIYTREEPLNGTEISEKCDTMSDRLKSRCAGLLEIRGTHQESSNMGTVQYMHRTVKDFLELPGTLSFLLSATDGTNFRLYESLLMSILLRHRLVPKKYIGPDLFATAKQVIMSAQEAYRAVGDPHDALRLLLNTLNTTLTAEYNEKELVRGSGGPPHWSGLVDFEQHPKQWPDSFTSAAVQYGLLPYVEDQLDRRKEILLQKQGRPLLDAAVCVQQSTIRVGLSETREMASLLLQAGADPNQNLGGYPVWQNFLTSVTKFDFRNEDLMILLEILEDFVAFGASFAGAVRTVD